MRNYYTMAGIRATCPATLVKDRNIHWSLYKSLVLGLGDDWRPEIASRLIEHIDKRDIKEVFQIISEVDSFTKIYERNTPLNLVRGDRHVVAFLKKFPFSETDTPFTPRETAISKLMDAERQCAATNRRLRERGISNDALPVFRRARLIIADLLGDTVSEADLKFILTKGMHGPGSTLSSVGNRTTPFYKYGDLPYTVTRRAAPYALAAISHCPKWLDYLESSGRRRIIPIPGTSQYQKEMQIFSDCVEYVDSDRVTFVPKDAKTERPIAVGASLNMYLQLGVKTFLERKLKEVGIDLTDQQKNRDMAYAGSRYAYVDGVVNPNQYVTIDLASASDTISYELVRYLLPPEWFALLCDLRHETGRVAEELIVYEKFSAMGNGFTFPLESLVFWALAKATILEQGYTCRTTDISVFGDDVIVRQYVADAVCETFSHAGFLINQEKSFFLGSFKESCGADFFRGYDVRPFYLKREIKSYEDLYFVANSISEVVKSHRGSKATSAVFAEVLRHIPPKVRRYIPLEAPIESGLRIPFSKMKDLGLNPWLQNDEISHFKRRRKLPYSVQNNRIVYNDFQSPHAIITSVQAKSYKGSEFVRLLTCMSFFGELTAPAPFYLSVTDKVILEASRSGMITRRKSVINVTRVVPISNWDGSYTKLQLLDHPSNWVK